MGELWLEISNGEAWLSGQPVLRDLNLQLRLGESTTILGPNGAGKSSLVKLIDRSLHPIVQPQSHFRLFGQTNVNLWDLRRHIGVLNSELEQRFPQAAPALEVVLSGFFGSMRLGRDQVPTGTHQARRACGRSGPGAGWDRAGTSPRSGSGPEHRHAHVRT